MKNNKLLGIVFLLSLSGCQFLGGSSSSSSPVMKESSNSSTTTLISSSTSNNKESSTSSSNSSSSSSSSLYFASEEEILNAISTGINNQSKVQKGTINLKNSSEVNAEYVFVNDKYGPSIKYIFKDSINYYGYDAQNKFYGLTDKNGKLSSASNQGENLIKGYNIDIYNGTEYYGAEGLLSYINELIVNNANLDFEILGASSGYKFKVGFVDIVNNNPRLYLSTVSFNLKNDIISYLDVKVDKYVNTSTQTNVLPDFSTNTYYLSLTAKPSTSYNVNFEQSSGVRENDNTYDIETLLLSSFDLINGSNVTLLDSLTLKKGVNVSYSLKNCLPSTANKNVDILKVNVVSGEKVLTADYNGSTGTLTFKPTKIGECVIEISSRRITKTINVKVKEPDPTNITVMYYSKNASSYDYNMINDEKHINVYENTSIYLKASFQPNDALQSFGVRAISSNKDNVTYENFIISSGVKDHETIKTSFLEKGDYVLEVYSLSNENLKETLTVTVNEKPEIDTLISNRYVQKSADGGFGVDINFTPSIGNSKVGSVNIIDGYEAKENRNKTYTYSYDEDAKTFTLMDGTNVAAAKLEFNDKYNLVYTRASSQVEVSLIVYTPIVTVSGEWSGNIFTDSDGVRHSLSIYFKTDGSGTFTYNALKNFSSIDLFEEDINATAVEGEDETINITFDQSSLESIYSHNKITSITNIVGCSTSVALTVTFNGQDYNVNLTRGG